MKQGGQKKTALPTTRFSFWVGGGKQADPQFPIKWMPRFWALLISLSRQIKTPSTVLIFFFTRVLGIRKDAYHASEIPRCALIGNSGRCEIAKDILSVCTYLISLLLGRRSGIGDLLAHI